MPLLILLALAAQQLQLQAANGAPEPFSCDVSTSARATAATLVVAFGPFDRPVSPALQLSPAPALPSGHAAMGAACGRCFGGGGETHQGEHARRKRGSRRGSRKSASHAADAVPAASRDCDGAAARVAPAPRGAPVLSPTLVLSAAPTPSAGRKPFAVAAASPPSPRGGGSPLLKRSESGTDVFYDAQDVFEDASALADAPVAFARHVLCSEPAGAGHACAGEAAPGGAPPPAAAEGDVPGEPVKTEEVLELEKLGQSFDDSFWSGKGSLAGRGLKTLQTLRHLKDVDLSKFAGVPISQHLPVSGSQARDALLLCPSAAR